MTTDIITVIVGPVLQVTGGGGGGGDATTLNGQNGAYYRSRTNHTGTQAASTITGLPQIIVAATMPPDISADPQGSIYLIG